MNILGEVIRCPLASHVGWALLHSLWQGALVGVAFWIVRSAMRRCSANARYLVGCLALLTLVALLLLTFVLHDAASSPANSESHAGNPGAYPGTGTIGLRDVGNLFVSAPAASLMQASYGICGQIAPFATIVWVVGVGIFSLRLSRSYRHARKLGKGDCSPVDVAWIKMLDDLRQRFGISRHVRLLKSALVEVPTMVGWLRPVILLPAAGLLGLTPAQMEAVLAHELAHVRRLDYLANACQCVVETLMFYHPVVWWISRCVREERENCCDDLVVEICKDRVEYARALAALEELRSDLPACALAASGGSLLARIRRLAGVSNAEGPASASEVSGLVAMCAGLLLILLGVRLLFLPGFYHSSVRVKIGHEQSQVVRAPGDHGMDSYDPYAVQEEFETIESRQVLGKVADILDLGHEWAERYGGGIPLPRSAVVTRLRDQLELRPIRNTSLIEIKVASEKPDEAAVLANTVAQVYQTQRNGNGDDGMRALNQILSEQDTAIHFARSNVEYLRKELNIPITAAAADSLPQVMSADTLRRIEKLRIEGKVQLMVQETLLDGLTRLRNERGREAVAREIDERAHDDLLSSLIQRSDLTELRLAIMQKDLSPENPQVLKVSKQMEDLLQRITNRVDGVLLGLEAKVQATKRSLEELEKEVSKVASNDIQVASSALPYFEAKRELRKLEELRQILSARVNTSKERLKATNALVVEIIDNASPAVRRSPPNLGGSFGLFAIGVTFCMVGRLIFAKRRDIATFAT